MEATMRIKPGMVMSKIGDDYVVVPIDKSALSFHGVIRLNETGSVIWKALEDGLAEEKIVESIMSKYEDAERTQVKQHVRNFISELKSANLLVD
jgi:hypothetical protein